MIRWRHETPPPRDSLSGSDAAQDAAIRAAMQKMIDAQEIPGAVTAIATRSGVTHFAATGAVKKNSLFWIASMTKPVAGTAIPAQPS